MKHYKRTRLALHHETVRRLANTCLRDVVGGGRDPIDTKADGQCPPTWNCNTDVSLMSACC